MFTSASAVCVTGLAVVDTGTYFTVFGQSILLILIQIGGLGILTFASYFSYFFKGGSTYENQLTLSEMTNSQRIGGVFNTFLMDRIQFYAENRIDLPSNELIDFKEALIFAFLGLLKKNNEINCLKSVTGASENHSSGVIFYP